MKYSIFLFLFTYLIVVPALAQQSAVNYKSNSLNELGSIFKDVTVDTAGVMYFILENEDDNIELIAYNQRSKGIIDRIKLDAFNKVAGFVDCEDVHIVGYNKLKGRVQECKISINQNKLFLSILRESNDVSDIFDRRTMVDIDVVQLKKKAVGFITFFDPISRPNTYFLEMMDSIKLLPFDFGASDSVRGGSIMFPSSPVCSDLFVDGDTIIVSSRDHIHFLDLNFNYIKSIYVSNKMGKVSNFISKFNDTYFLAGLEHIDPDRAFLKINFSTMSNSGIIGKVYEIGSDTDWNTNCFRNTFIKTEESMLFIGNLGQNLYSYQKNVHRNFVLSRDENLDTVWHLLIEDTCKARIFNSGYYENDKIYLAGFEQSCSSNWEFYPMYMIIDIEGNVLTKTDNIDQKNRLVNFYPNPTNGILKWDQSLKIDKLQFYSMSGVLNRSLMVKGKFECDISDLKSGIYIVKGQDENNQPLFTKIIKK